MHADPCRWAIALTGLLLWAATDPWVARAESGAGEAAPAVVASPEPPATPTTRPLLWRISSTPPAYLYGTIHLPDPRVLALPASVERTFAQAQVFCGEVRLDDVAQQQMAGGAYLPDGQTLTTLLPPELYQRTARYLEKAGLPIVVFENQKIWAVATTLSLLDYLHASEPVLDLKLQQMARAQGKSLDALESVYDQIRIMDDIDLAGQISLLRQTLDYLDALEPGQQGPVEKLLEAYLAGDEERLMKTAFEYADLSEPSTARFLDALVNQRNVRMADEIDRRLASGDGQAYFFAIGGLHVPGPEGVGALLAKKGWELVRVTPE